MSRERGAGNPFAALPEHEQLAIARHVCANRGKQPVHKLGVNAVGVGYKKRAGDLLPCICIGFLVEHKRDKPSNPVPRHIGTDIQRGAKRTRYLIPTDVEEIGAGLPQVT